MTRVVEDLNRALHDMLQRDPGAYLIGEDITDPYGGAFKVTKGLSTRFPGRVLGTPISEAAIGGVAAGLAMSGHVVVVELMFADFAALAFDQIVNFAAKSVSMYGSRLPLRLIVRCPSGGRRGYGPTHSQSPHKHFLGVADLSVYEMSPVHPNAQVLERMVAGAHPCLYVEDKSLYGQRMLSGPAVDDLFRIDFLDQACGYARVAAEPGALDVLLLAPGGMFGRAVAAAQRLLLEHETAVQIVVPSRLYPFDVEPIADLVEHAGLVCVAEESTAGGTWGAEVAARIHRRCWPRMRRPVLNVHSGDSIIPAAVHLEEAVLAQERDIYDAVVGGLRV